LALASSSYAASDNNRRNSNKNQSGQTLTGKATYYPNSLNGHKTSSGQAFHQSGHTAASNRLPLGTHVTVTNPKSGKSTDVKITDRGPKLGNHKIDLSKKAASEIGLTHKEGTVPVKIKIANDPLADQTHR
jgi:rare lipoprotein A